MRAVVVIRPQPGCSATVGAAQAEGLPARAFPLFEVRAVAWNAPAAEAFDALLLGSSNALRHGGPALRAYRGKPAYCVGPVTATAAREAGLDVAAAGTGLIDSVLPLLQPGHQRLLRLSGRERVAIGPPPGVTIDERVVYASEPLPLPDELEALLREGALVLLHSAEAARHLAALCDGHGIARSGVALATFAPRISRAAGAGWAKVETARTPTDAALLALARQMCQDLRG